MADGAILQDIDAACDKAGLVALAAVHDERIGTLVLIGNAGPAMWRAFAASPEHELVDHPLDAWSRRVIGDLAVRFGAAALFPFGGPPHRPFQRWAILTGQFCVSPLGVLVHPTFGPWFAFRGALAFDHARQQPHDAAADPCGTCREKPCLAACPVGAVALDHDYDHAACRSHVSRRNNSCYHAGCRARHACPYGRAYAHLPEQARFHMDAFIG